MPAGRAKPTSGALMYYAGDENGCNSTGIALEQSAYWNTCVPNHVLSSKDPGAETSVVRRFVLDTEHLPRQARDKHAKRLKRHFCRGVGEQGAGGGGV